MPLAVEIVRTEADKEKERREHEGEHAKATEEHELVDATLGLARWTAGLAVVTGLLFIAAFYTAWSAERSSAKALDASTKATATLNKDERPYVTGGGYSPNHGPGYGARQFHLEVQNLGKTPAFLTDYDVQFAKLADLTDRPAREVEPRSHYDDRLAPAERKEIDLIPVGPADADVVFGAFWYLDWAKERREFRFVHRASPVTTHAPISAGWCTRTIQSGTRRSANRRAWSSPRRATAGSPPGTTSDAAAAKPRRRRCPQPSSGLPGWSSSSSLIKSTNQA